MNLRFALTVCAATEEHVISCSCLVGLSLPVSVHFILLELFVRKVGFFFTNI